MTEQVGTYLHYLHIIIYYMNKYYLYGGRALQPNGVRSGCPEIKNRPENGETAARAAY